MGQFLVDYSLVSNLLDRRQFLSSMGFISHHMPISLLEGISLILILTFSSLSEVPRCHAGLPGTRIYGPIHFTVQLRSKALLMDSWILDQSNITSGGMVSCLEIHFCPSDVPEELADKI